MAFILNGPNTSQDTLQDRDEHHQSIIHPSPNHSIPHSKSESDQEPFKDLYSQQPSTSSINHPLPFKKPPSIDLERPEIKSDVSSNSHSHHQPTSPSIQPEIGLSFENANQGMIQMLRAFQFIDAHQPQNEQVLHQFAASGSVSSSSSDQPRPSSSSHPSPTSPHPTLNQRASSILHHSDSPSHRQSSFF